MSPPPSSGLPASATARVRSALITLTTRFADAIRHLIQVRIMDSATVLTAKAFMSVAPVLFVVVALAPSGFGDGLRHSLSSALGLNGAALTQVSSLLAAPETGTRQTYGLLSVLIVLVSATSCSRSLQKLCERTWYLPRAETRVAGWRWVAWIILLVAGLYVSALARTGLGAGDTAGLVFSTLISIGLWWWTQHLLLSGRVGWPPLLPGAVLAGVGLSAWLAFSRLYLPGALNRSIALYGPLGSVFTALSWLLAFCTILTVAIAVGYLIAHQPLLSRWLKPPETPGPEAGR